MIGHMKPQLLPGLEGCTVREPWQLAAAMEVKPLRMRTDRPRRSRVGCASQGTVAQALVTTRGELSEDMFHVKHCRRA